MRILASACLILLLAGCTTPTGEPTATDPNDPVGPQAPQPDTPPTDARAFAVELDGSLGPGGCVPAGPNACSGGSVGDDAWVFVEMPEAGTWDVALELVWEASSELDAELELDVLRFHRDGSTTIGYGLDSARGDSPLVLNGTGLDVDPAEDEGLWISVKRTSDLASPLYGHAGLEQPFSLRGTAVGRAA